MFRKLVLFGLVLIGILLLLVAAFVGLSVATMSQSTGGALASGRTVEVGTNSWFLSAEYKKDVAIIKTASRIIVVQPQQVMVDGTSVAPLDPNCKSVKLQLQGNQLTVTTPGVVTNVVLP